MFSGKRILLGVTGGIAAYKAVYLLREYQKAGADVRVIMTPSATKFVGTETFSALSRHDVPTDVFSDGKITDSWTKHIYLGEWADLFVIAPCTANTLAAIVQGTSDNMLTSTLLAARCPVLICPTMDGGMYENPAVQSNLDRVRKRGIYILEPDSGYLASGIEDKGRLPEPEQILQRSAGIIRTHAIQGPLTGKKVVVTGGPTREYLDPVRFLSNPSSGKMGIAMADAARALGGEVTFLHGPLSVTVPERLNPVPFVSADDLFQQIKVRSDADLIIMTAAVSDFKPKQLQSQKVKKTDASLQLELEPTQDILKWLGEHKKAGQKLIGFAMETENLEASARRKLKEKRLDWICGNRVSADGEGFASDTNTILLMGSDGTSSSYSGSKPEIASQILRKIFPDS
ncbi:MAG: bifunctional phosphopantothenoylcysteine decarboxylase/phosphopantothenate--cysteine ligase CoaBC [Balneolaceae bacterium]|nr:MAG: bifunctional phosphopantothenoylcysteine decarboxylase/phosphopantothenate--cysteine ligase CoaBC [Balneolaceae bacterium]